MLSRFQLFNMHALVILLLVQVLVAYNKKVEEAKNEGLEEEELNKKLDLLQVFLIIDCCIPIQHYIRYIVEKVSMNMQCNASNITSFNACRNHAEFCQQWRREDCMIGAWLGVRWEIHTRGHLRLTLLKLLKEEPLLLEYVTPSSSLLPNN